MGKEEEMEGLIEEYSNSGQSIKEYCQRKGIAPSKFFYWRKKLTLAMGRRGSFDGLDLTSEERCSELEIIYPNGVRLKAGKQEVGLLQQLIRLY